MAIRVLLVQTDMRSAQPLARFFKQRGDEVWQAWDLVQAKGLLEQVKPHLLLMDLHFASQEWYTYLRAARADFPNLKIIMTNKYPDLQREMKARDQGVQVFLRQPFSPRWIDQAIRRLSEETVPVRGQITPPVISGQVRMPVRYKITLPYLVLALLFALASSYLISQVVLESIQDRFLNQLVKTGLQGQDWMVQEESRLLEVLRLGANAAGVPEAILSADAESLRQLILPVVANSQEEEIILLDAQGARLLTLTHTPGGGPADYNSSRGGTDCAGWEFVQRVLQGQTDSSGDKFAGRGQGPLGEMLYVAGPVFDAAGTRAGVVLVGKSLKTIARQLSQDTLSDVSFYDISGRPVGSTLFKDSPGSPVEQSTVLSTLSSQDKTTTTRDLTISSVRYSEILGPWEVRGGADIGVIGISLAQTFLVRTSRTTQIEIFVLVAAAIVLVITIGLLLAGLITRPLARLVDAAAQVANGNLEVKVDASGDDELAVLAKSFNYMVAGLQEGSIYRDLLGRTVSPEVRETLRQTFSSGALRLEGQEAVATVLMTDIRGFTALSEKADPATVFNWLNEYFSQIVPIVTNYGGVVNQFEGDAMLAFFGTLPRLLSPKQSALAACQAAAEALQAIGSIPA
jgi:CheY-like chemotaxis protein/HAMP domain-containing protein